MEPPFISKEEFEADLQRALYYYNHIYEYIGDWTLNSQSRATVLGDQKSRRCRFCGRLRPDVTFRSKAHALPESLGNKSLFVAYECDACNSKFGSTYEHHLGAWTKPFRTFSMTKGKKNRVPSIITPDGLSISSKGDMINVSHDADHPDFIYDDISKTIRMNVARDAYKPAYVLKSLIKIGLSLVPEKHIAEFKETIDWINNKPCQTLVNQSFIWQFNPGPSVNDTLKILLLRRINSYVDAPYCILFIALPSIYIQVVVPCMRRDWYMKGRSFSVPFFPTYLPNAAEMYGPPIRRTMECSSSDWVRGKGLGIELLTQGREKIT